MRNQFSSLIILVALTPLLSLFSTTHAAVRQELPKGTPPAFLTPAPKGIEILELIHQRDLSIQHQKELAQQRQQHALEAAQAAEQAQTQQVTAPAQIEAPIGSTQVGCGDNLYKQFIYMHESGCNTYDPNPDSGACGIGQANPCSKMPCGHAAADFACQDAFFTQYAIERYHGWAQAYQYWIAHRYW